MPLDPSLQQNIQLEIERSLRLATAQHQTGGLQLAEELYLSILQLNPAHPDANHNMGVLTVQKNQPAASLSYFLAALDTDPARGQYWTSYINALFQAGQVENAQQVLALARQQGLEGDKVEALALQLEGTQTPVTAPDVSTAVANDNLKKPNTKPVLPPKKYPGPQEINALSALFNKGRYAEALPLAEKMTARYPIHGQGWKALGIAFIQTGKNAEALVPMQRAAELLPDDIGVHNYLGNTLNDLGHLNEAELSYRRILKINPAHAEALSNLGNNLRNQGRLNEAEASYSRALQINPNYAEAHNNLGNTLWELGRLDEAETCFRRAIQLKPDFVAAHCNLGNNLRSQGKLNEAEASYRKAIQLAPNFVEAHNNLAVTLKELGRLDEAVASCRRAVEIKPDYAEAHSNLGGALRETGKLDEAVVSFRRALALKPDFAEASSNLGGILRILGQLDEAVERCRKALQIQPDYAEAHCNLAGALKELGRLDDAEESARQALTTKPGFVDAFSNLAIVLMAKGSFAAAINSLLTALTLRPDFQEARINLGFAQLSSGHLTEGWKNHEFRTDLDKKRFPHLPFWAGENLHGKTILISCEQGIGDEIMFASQYSEIIAQADRCVIECTAKLVPLFTRSFPKAQMVPKLNPPHPATLMNGFDYQCHAGSLAQWLRPNLASFPQQNSFLIPDPARVAYWKTRLAELGPEPKIGFCWRSGITTGERNLHYTTLDQWVPIFTQPNVHFINLQYDECSAELNEVRQHFGVPLHNFPEVDMYNDLDETAALIQALNLVICAPTAVSSIAAALGVDTWVMSYGISWEVHGTDHCPWFPALHYFTRRWNQSWDEIIQDVSSQLHVGETRSGEPLNSQKITGDTSLQQTILEEINKALRQAVTQHQSGQLQVAEELYLAILQLNPKQPDANHNLGVLSVQTNQPAAAQPYFLTALNAAPARGQYWISYIDALIRAGQSEDARQVLKLARQQGLEGEEAEALARRMEDSVQESLNHNIDMSVVTSVVAAKTRETAKIKPATSKKKHPSTQEINTLSILLAKAKYMEAAQLAREITERFPFSGLGWKALGIAFMQMGNDTDALAPMQKAAELMPNDIDAHNNLGNILQNMERLTEAEISYRKVLAIKPTYAEVHCNLGNNLKNQEKRKEAEACYNRALQLKPDYMAAHNNLGNMLLELGKFDEAESIFRRAIRLKPNFAEAHNNLSITLKALGRLDEALASGRQAVAINPAYAEAHNNLGGTLRELGKLDEAALSFRYALQINPAFAEASSNLGGTLRELGQLEEAMTWCRHAVTLNPAFAGAYSNMAGIQKELGQLNEAVASCRRAIEIDPDYFNAYSNLGSALETQGEFDASIASFRHALTIKPDFQAARMNMGFAQLSCGQLTEGWENHEFRTSIDRKRFIRYPYWAGENLTGKSILIWGEQGIGDEIMFASQFAEIIARAGRCVIECTAKLVPLLTRSFPQALIVPKFNPPHPTTQGGFDYQCPAGSLAQWLRPNLASFPSQNAYLKANPERVTYWKTRLMELGPGPKVGFCWRSGITTGERNLHYTSLDQWEPILTTPGVHFINLQYDQCSAELDEAGQRFGVPLHAFTEIDMYNDLNEAAALIKALDLVISAPTAVSVIAAAQGVNTWVMSYGISWEVHGTDHCPWFPTLHYFTRRWNQAWDETIEQISEQLKSHAWQSQSKKSVNYQQ
jgi:tetratricopeptide (TPR) repeat protein